MGILDDFLDGVTDRDEYVGVCAFCGFPLTKYQIAGDIAGTLVDYIEHRTVSCSFCVCAECMVKMMEYVNDGPEAAFRRVYVQAVLTRQAETGEYDPTLLSTEE